MLVLGLVEVPWWGLILLTILGYFAYTCRHFTYFWRQGIPAVTPVPVLGSIWYYFNQSMAVGDLRCLRKWGDVGYYGEFMGSVPTLVVFDEKMCSDILVKDFTTFTNRVVFESNDVVTNSMLLTLKDDRWKHVRNEMTPTFTTGKMKKMNSEINRCANTLAQNILECAKLHETVEVREYAGGYTMDVIGSTAFGIRLDSQKDRNNAFVTHAKRAFNFDALNIKLLTVIIFPEIASLLMKFGIFFGFFAKDITDFFLKITRDTMKMRREDTDQTKTDFIQLMMNIQKNGKSKLQEGQNENQISSETGLAAGITTNEILANAMLFFIAGYDTTSTSLSFLLYNLALYPDCQQKLVDEINLVMGDEDFVEYSMLHEMPYLEQCINENLRMYPPAVRTNRSVERDVTLNGVFFRKGMKVDIAIFAIMHDPKKWPDPDRFDPERFSAENKKNRNPFHYLPFGQGPRHCIGMRLALQELKVATIHVLRKVKVTTCSKTPIPIEYENTGGLLKPKGGILLKVSPRNKA